MIANRLARTGEVGVNEMGGLPVAIRVLDVFPSSVVFLTTRYQLGILLGAFQRRENINTSR